MIETEDDAVKFMKSVKFALRYNATPALPLASMYLGQDTDRVVAISFLSGLVLIAHWKNLLEEFSVFIERRKVHAKSNRHEL